MTTLFGFSMDSIMHVVLAAFVAATVITGLFALKNRLLVKMALRNVPRRRAQSALIVVGLMLATVITTSAFATGDTMSYSIRAFGANGLGNVDEVVTTAPPAKRDMASLQTTTFFPVATAGRSSVALAGKPADGVMGAIVLPAPMRDTTSRQEKAATDLVAIPAGYPAAFGPLTRTDGASLSLSTLPSGGVFINQRAAYALGAHVGDHLTVFAAGKSIQATVRAIVRNEDLAAGGLVSTQRLDPVVIMPLGRAQRALGHEGQITTVLVSNNGDALSGATHSGVVAHALRAALADPARLATAEQMLLSPPAVRAVRQLQARPTLSPTLRAKISQLRADLALPLPSTRLASLLTDGSVVAQLKTLHFTGAPGLRRVLDHLSPYQVVTSKQDILQISNNVGTEFTAGFMTFGLFSIASGLILIFLIFFMLAAERRAEMGMARAVGMKRRHLIQQFLFEGYLYDLVAALVGVVLGVVVALSIVAFMASLFSTGTDLTLQRHVEPRSLIVAFCLGALVTFLTVLGASWWTSRLNIVAAIRDLPEDLGKLDSIAGAFFRPLSDLKSSWARLRRGRVGSGLTALAAAPWHFLLAFRVFISRGPILLLAGYLLLHLGIQDKQGFPFTLGISLLLIGGSMLIRWLLVLTPLPDRLRHRIGYSLAGISLVIFWLLPFDAFRSDLQIGIEMFFLSGMMLMLGGVWTVMYNLDLVLKVVMTALFGLRRLTPMLRIAVTYPGQHRLRTGLTVFMFSLVVFALMVEAVLTSSFGSEALNLRRDFGGYQIYGAIAPTNPIKDAGRQLASDSRLRHAVAAYGGATRLPISLEQPSAPRARWSPYVANVVDNAYLSSTQFSLHARAQGFTSDRQVWQTIRTHPGYAVVDAAIIAQPGGNQTSLVLSGLKYTQRTFHPLTLRLKDSRNGTQATVTVIGVLDQSALQLDYTQGVLTSRATFTTSGDRLPASSVYFFRVANGSDVHQTALALGSAFLRNGLDVKETAVEFADNQSINIGFNNMLEGFMALGLVVGIAALGVIATRAVVERRQEIGMLRAIGFQRQMVQGSFLLESSFIYLLGAGIGVVLGILLGGNVVHYFAKTDSALHLVIPWLEIAAIVVGAYLVSLLTTYLPAWQAARIYPAEALRYE